MIDMKKENEKEILVSVVICAYNEEKHIAQTLKDLLRCKTADEIIVVNDGSKDKTLKILKGFGGRIKLVSYRRNKGKGYAFVKGFKRINGKVVVMMDAHLKNLSNRYLNQLVRPILQGKANYVFGRSDSPRGRPEAVFQVVGQRAYLKKLLEPHLKEIEKSKFGLEIILNDICPFRWGEKVRLKGLLHLVKEERMTINEAVLSYLQYSIEASKTKMELRLNSYEQLRRLFSSKEMKSLKDFRRKLSSIKDKEVFENVESYVLGRFKNFLK